MRDALEGEIQVYFRFLELDQQGVEEGVGREDEGAEGVLVGGRGRGEDGGVDLKDGGYVCCFEDVC